MCGLLFKPEYDDSVAVHSDCCRGHHPADDQRYVLSEIIPVGIKGSGIYNDGRYVDAAVLKSSDRRDRE
jgi:hypothetical protein